MKDNNYKIGGRLAAIVIVILIICLFKCTVKIKPGYAGIVYNIKGGIEDKVLTQGWHLVSPWKKVKSYTIGTEQAYLSKDRREGSEEDESFGLPTSTGKVVNADIEFSYHYDIDKLPKVFVKFKGIDGKDIEKIFIRGKIKAWAGEVSSKYDVLDIYGSKRAQLNSDVCNHVKGKFEPYGIVIESVNFPRIGLDKETEKAIQKRINAQQALEKAKIEKDQATVEAAKKEIQAQAEAKAKLIKAESEAKSNNAITKSINSTLVEYKKIEKWDGKVPKVSGNNSSIINLPKQKEK